ncbi:MAG: hypothetical protein ACOH2K_09110 [Burkholderiaceae bacterium]
MSCTHPTNYLGWVQLNKQGFRLVYSVEDDKLIVMVMVAAN